MTVSPKTVVVFIAVAVMACDPAVQVRHVRTGPALAAKPANAPIPVFFNQAPGRAYREIGQIRVRSQGEDATIDRVLHTAVEDARALGADAIIIELRAHYAAVPVTVDCAGRPNVPKTDRLNARATAIVFTPSDRPEPTPTGPPPRAGCVE